MSYSETDSETGLDEIYRDLTSKCIDIDDLLTYSVEKISEVIECVVNNKYNLIGKFDNVILSDKCAKIVELFIKFDLTMTKQIGKCIIIFREDKNVAKLWPLLDADYNFCRIEDYDRVENHTSLYRQLIEKYSKHQHINFAGKPRRFCDLRIIAADGVAAEAHITIIFAMDNMNGCLAGESDSDALTKFGISCESGKYIWRLPDIMNDVGGDHVRCIIDAIYTNTPIDMALAEKSEVFKSAAIKFGKYLGLEV